MDIKQQPQKAITFGQWNGMPLEWIVVKRELFRALLITRECIDVRPFCADTFSACLDLWLEQDFPRLAFTPEERRKIGSGPRSLTVKEAERFFPDDASRRCVLSLRAQQKNGHAHTSEQTGNAFCSWWLRDTKDRSETAGLSPLHLHCGYRTYDDDFLEDCYAAFITCTGTIDAYGDNVTARHAVRPVLWLNE